MPTKSGVNISAATRKLLRKVVFAERGRAVEIAAKIGIDRRHLYGILAGRFAPSELTLRRLCRAVGLKSTVRTIVEVGRGVPK